MKDLDLNHAIPLAKSWLMLMPYEVIELDMAETLLGEVALLGSGGTLNEGLKVSGPQSLPVNLEGAPQGKWQPPCPDFLIPCPTLTL